METRPNIAPERSGTLGAGRPFRSQHAPTVRLPRALESRRLRRRPSATRPHPAALDVHGLDATVDRSTYRVVHKHRGLSSHAASNCHRIYDRIEPVEEERCQQSRTVKIQGL